MADDNELINQADIEALLQSGGASKAAGGEDAAKPDEAASAPDAPAAETGGELGQADTEEILGGGSAGSSQSVSAKSDPAQQIEDADKLLGQDDIEKLLSQSGTAGSAANNMSSSQSASATSASAPAGESDIAGAETISPADVEFLFSQAEKALDSVTDDRRELPPSTSQFHFGEFSGSPANTEIATLDLLNDVELDLKIELGRTNMYLEDVLKLRKGAVVPLDKLAGDPVDIYVNGRLIARGEVLVLNDNFCVRVAELVASAAPAV